MASFVAGAGLAVRTGALTVGLVVAGLVRLDRLVATELEPERAGRQSVDPGARTYSRTPLSIAVSSDSFQRPPPEVERDHDRMPPSHGVIVSPASPLVCADAIDEQLDLDRHVAAPVRHERRAATGDRLTPGRARGMRRDVR